MASSPLSRRVLLLQHFFSPLAIFLSTLLAPSPTLPALKTSLLRNGYASATATVLVAVLVNHIRRALFPWLAQFLWYQPVQTLKFARSSPHFFLQDSMEAWTFSGLALWLVCTYVISVLRRMALGRLVWGETSGEVEVKSKANGQANGEGQGEVDESQRPAEVVMGKPDAVSPGKFDAAVCRAAYLALVLASAEYAFAEACWSFAHIYAYGRIVLSGDASEQHFLRSLLAATPLGAMLQIYLVLRWTFKVLWRNATEATYAMLCGRLSLPLFHAAVWGVTGHVVRYSNYYFVGLEMSAMLITFAWVAAGLGVLAVGKGRDVLLKRRIAPPKR